MKIDIFSDVACPWCYIGKRRFENALAAFPQKDQVEITWHSYQLDPTAPKTSDMTLNELLAKKYGMSMQQAAAANNRVTTLAAELGLDYRMDKARPANTFDAHRLIQLAGERGLQDEVEERFFRAYFSEGEALGDPETLVRLVSEVGIDPEEARAVLAGNDYADAVREDIQEAREIGIQGVPFFILDEKYGISGAQPTELFEQALEQVWAEAHPKAKITTIAGSEDAACEGDNCVIPQN